MTFTVKTTSYDGIRTQTRANLKICGIPNLSRLEIITSSTSGRITAWIVDTVSKDSINAIMKGPTCETCEAALEGLLEATAELVSKKLEDGLAGFDAKLSAPMGGGFLLESVLDGVMKIDERRDSTAEG